jgi:TonB family protein
MAAALAIVISTASTAAGESDPGATRDSAPARPTPPARLPVRSEKDAGGQAHPRPAEDATSLVAAPVGEELRVIGERVRAHVDEITNCYEARLSRRPALAGRMMARFDIGSDGSVTSASADGIDDQELERCVIDAIRRWKFEKPGSGGKLRVAYPFVLRSKSGS